MHDTYLLYLLTIFKFGTHIGRGQFLPPDHKLARNWPTVSRGGAYCGGHLDAQLVILGNDSRRRCHGAAVAVTSHFTGVINSETAQIQL